MNRSMQREYSAATIGSARSMSAASLSQQHRRGASLSTSKNSDAADSNLDLFSRSRRTVSLPTADESNVSSLKLGKIPVIKSRSGLDDLLTSTDGGKHDYDWLLTPPDTPLNPSAEENEFQRSRTTARSRSVSRSASTTKPSSKLSTTYTESSNAPSRPTRSSSVSRPSMSYTPSSNNYSSIRSSSSNILNTSSASVSSYIRPSSPITRTSSSSRPSTPSRSSTQSRNSTPSRGRSSPSLSSSIETKPRSSVSSRPSTPTSRSTQGGTNLTPSPVFSSSRSSTPSRRSSITSSSSGANLSVSTGHIMSNGRTQSSASRPSSPISRVRPQQQQPAVVPSDFPHDTPPNLRTTLPDRAISAGRSRPNASMTKPNTDNQGSGHSVRRSSSPMVSRGRSVEPSGPISVRTRANVSPNGHSSDVHEPRKSIYGSESPGRKSVRGSTNGTADANGFGRSISKNSLNMAIRHMDIRGGTRPVSSTVLYPQSIRSAPSSARPQYSSHVSSNNSSSSDLNGRLSCVSDGSFVSDHGSTYVNTLNPENNNSISNGRLYGRLNEVDNIFESSRYDTILLKEDLKSTNWLHGGDDQSTLFDNGFETLPEPFGLS